MVSKTLDAAIMIEMLESSYDGIWLTDGEGKVLFVNSANLALLGVTEESLLHKTTQQLLDEGILSDSVILDVLEQKKQISKTCYNYNTNLTVLATATPIFNDDGSIKYVVNNVRDITTLYKLQSNLVDKEELIRLQNQQIQNIKSRLGMDNIVAQSKSFISMVELARRIATFDSSTALILGESGTGKELIAELIVNNSPRKDKPYIQINCGAIPEHLIESELFGYEKGSFTGADSQGRKGLFETANTGTVFLDEIGDLSLPLQGKLLRVLQQKTVTRIGSTTPIHLDVRIIAATNCDLEQMVKDNLFREDLFYRLNVVTLHLPPLRERREDIIPLAHHFLKVVNKKYHTEKSFSSGVIDIFENYDWPGNVRELENLIENLIITSISDVITKENLPKKLLPQDTLISETQQKIMPLKSFIEVAEKEMIDRAIKECGSVRKAAAALEVNPSTIVRKLQKNRE